MGHRQIFTSYRELDTKAVDVALIDLNPYKRRKAERAIQEAFYGHEKASIICDESSGLVRNTTRHGFKISFMLTQSTFKVTELFEQPNDPSDDDSDGYFVIKRNGRFLNFPLHSKALGDCRCNLTLVDSSDLRPVNRARYSIVLRSLKSILDMKLKVTLCTRLLDEARQMRAAAIERRRATLLHEASHRPLTALTLRTNAGQASRQGLADDLGMHMDNANRTIPHTFDAIQYEKPYARKRLGLVRRTTGFWASYACRTALALEYIMMVRMFGLHTSGMHNALILAELRAIEQRSVYLSVQQHRLLSAHAFVNRYDIEKVYGLSGQQEADPWCLSRLQALELGRLLVVDPKGEVVTRWRTNRPAHNDDANHSTVLKGLQEHHVRRSPDALGAFSAPRVSTAKQTHFGSIDMLKLRKKVVLKSEEQETFNSEVRAKEIWWNRCNTEKKGVECTKVNNADLIQSNENLERLVMFNHQVTKRPLNWHQEDSSTNRFQ